MAEETLTVNAEDHQRDFLRGETDVPWALSVFSHPTRSVACICMRAWPILSHNKIRVSNVGELRALGYEVIRDGKKGHCLIPLDPPPWDWGPLQDVGFQPAELNPEKQRRKKLEEAT
jgi:hypothetical protein